MTGGRAIPCQACQALIAPRCITIMGAWITFACSACSAINRLDVAGFSERVVALLAELLPVAGS